MSERFPLSLRDVRRTFLQGDRRLDVLRGVTLDLRAGEIVALVGQSGSGKSTLVATLTAHLRRAGQKVGVVAIDPSSPYSGGAILGDRIRMADHVCDAGVYIRSMATRGDRRSVPARRWIGWATRSAISRVDPWADEVTMSVVMVLRSLRGRGRTSGLSVSRAGPGPGAAAGSGRRTPPRAT